MRYWSIAIAVSFCLSAFLMASIAFAPGAEAALYVVDDDGGPWADFDSIQEAVDAASSGDIFRIYAGTYNESVVVHESVSMTGNGTDATFVNGGEAAFNISWGKVVIEEMNVSATMYCFKAWDTTQVVIRNNSMWDRAPGGYSGFGVHVRHSSEVDVWDNMFFRVNTSIYLNDALNAQVLNNDVKAYSQGIVASACAPTIRGNALSGMAYGIYLLSTNGATVAGNTIRAWYWGIRPWFTTGDVVRANSIYDADYGIHVGRCTALDIVENVMFGTGIYLDGYALMHFDSHTIKYNYVNEKDVMYVVGASSMTFNSSVGQLILVDCSDILVDSLNISYTTAGLLAAYVDDLTVQGHRAYGCYFGIYLEVTTRVEIVDPVLWDNMYGVYVRHADGVSVDDMEATGNEYGFFTFFDPSAASGNITITDADVSGGYDGISINHARDLLLGGIVVDSASHAGIVLQSVTNATVTKFSVIGGMYGVYTTTASAIYCNNLTIENGAVEGQFTTGIFIASTENATVTRCTVEEAYRGIHVFDRWDNVLVGNEAVDCNVSIEIDGAANITLWGNVMTGGGGVYLEPCYVPYMGSHSIPANNTLDGRPVLYAVGWTNAVVSGDWSQVMLLSSSNVTLFKLRLVDACAPVLMVDCDSCAMEGCVVRRAGLHAVLVSTSEDCTFRNNRIVGSADAALLFDKGCVDNVVHGNLLLGNNDRPWQSSQAADLGANNTWDDGSAGNYWSDYNGTDADMDGIGDTPYNITSMAVVQDRYPLMNPRPSLTGPSVTPEEGTGATTFNFSVTYSDAYGDAVAVMLLFVDGVAHATNATAEGNWTDGWTFYLEMTLAPGDHMFNFTASDSVLWNSTGDLPGPHVNTPPVLGDGGVLPANGSSTQSYMFWVEYRDGDNESASIMEAIVDGTPHSMTLLGDEGTANFSATVTYIYESTLSPGDHTYNFTAFDGMEWAGSPDRPGPYVNHPPEIAGWMVTPAFGNASTVFNFSLSYNDAETENATAVRLYVDSIPFDVPYGGFCQCTGGTRYTLNITLDLGIHAFNMTVFDGWDWATNDGGTIKVDRPPIISDGTVEPVGANESVPFTFNVTYTDEDDDPPSWVHVHIGNDSFAMSMAEPSDDNFTDGAVFTYVTLLNAGNHTFGFTGSDGWMESWLDGGTIHVNASDLPVQPMAHIDIIDPRTVRSDRAVHLQGHGSGGTMVAYEWTSDVDGQIGNGSMVDVGGLTPGDHNVSFRVLNDDALWSEPVNGTFHVNHPPTIPIWKVTPTWGNASTLFNFSAAFDDVETTNATAFLVFIDGEMRPMTYGGWCPCISGATRYEHFTGLAPGNHTFNFTAFDGMEWAATGTFHVKVNQRPTLGTGSVSPGSGNDSTVFAFRVTYGDPDNDAPWRVRVVIDGTGYPMAKLHPADDDFTDGAVYIYRTLMDAGNHTYHFIATDWYEEATIVGGGIEVVEGEGTITPMAYIDRVHPLLVEPGEAVEFRGRGVGGNITAYEWRSDIDGILGAMARIVRSDLSVGAHNISFRVRNDDDVWSEPANASLIVQANAPLPDAAILSVTIVGSDHVEGEAVHVIVTVANRGNASGTFIVDVYFHPANSSFSAPTDLTLIDAFNATLGVDATEAFTVTWTATAGDHEIVAWADPEDLVQELRQYNNVGTVDISVAPLVPGGGEEKRADEFDVLVVAGMALLIVLIVAALIVLMRRPRGRVPADLGPAGRSPTDYGMVNGKGVAPPLRRNGDWRGPRRERLGRGRRSLRRGAALHGRWTQWAEPHIRNTLPGRTGGTGGAGDVRPHPPREHRPQGPCREVCVGAGQPF